MDPSDAVESNSISEYTSTDDEEVLNHFEFRILMAYAKRTLLIDERSKSKLTTLKMDEGNTDSSSAKRNSVGPSERTKVERKKSTVIQSDGSKKRPVHRSKRKFKWKKMVPRCLRAETSHDVAAAAEECGKSEDSEVVIRWCDHVSELDPYEVAEILQDVMNSTVSFRTLRSPSLEEDGADDQKTIDRIVEFLTTKGDFIDEEIKKDPQFGKLFGEKPSFSFFKKIMDYALQATLPAEINSEAENETKVNLNKFAFVVHATTKFAVTGNHPMTRIMGFGTKYLQENFSTWLVEKGGWEKIIEEEHIECQPDAQT